MIPLSEAQNFVLAAVKPKEPEKVSLDEAFGMTASENLLSNESIPAYDNSAMDGYAISETDRVRLNGVKAVTLKVHTTIAAGPNADQTISDGEAARIMTGAPIPNGTSCVVIVEDTTFENDSVTIKQSYQPGDNIRRAGSDIASGEKVLARGTTLQAAHLGVLASVGHSSITAFGRPQIGVISTGNELVEENRSLRRGEIRDSNRHSIMAIVRTTGAEVVDLGIVRDDPQVLRDAFASAARDLDAIITSGGVSVGDFDYTKSILKELSGNTARWMQIAIRPAKPFAFGLIGSTPFFALPGNPVSALVSFELLVRPAIRKMLGQSQLFSANLSAIAVNDYQRSMDGKTHFVRSQLFADQDGTLFVEALDKQSSHMLHEMSRANSLVIVPDGNGFSKSDQVKVMPLGTANLFF